MAGGGESGPRRGSVGGAIGSAGSLPHVFSGCARATEGASTHAVPNRAAAAASLRTTEEV